MKKDTIRQYSILAAAIITIAINVLANALPLNGQNTGAISDRFLVYFVPAGYVFAIWGLIYIGLLAYSIYQVLPAQRENPAMRSTGALFVLSCAANSAWIFFWHYELFPLTLVAMLTLLFSLIAIYLRLGIGRSRVSSAEKWLVHLPISIYLGWITVATIANITDLLYFLGWNGGGIAPQVWAVIMIAAGVIISIAMGLRHGDSAFLLVVIWAYIGIAVKQAGAPLVVGAAWTGAALVAVALLAGVWKRRSAIVS